MPILAALGGMTWGAVARWHEVGSIRSGLSTKVLYLHKICPKVTIK